MKIKKILGFLTAVALLLSLSMVMISFDSKNNREGKRLSSQLDDEIVYYWFFAKVRIDKQTDTYKVSGTGGGLFHGYQKVFEKSLWRGLSNRQIAIGPFMRKNEAVNAKRLYRASKDQITGVPVGEPPAQYHWFPIEFYQSKRTGIYIMKSSPSSVNSGTEEGFITSFYEKLDFKSLMVGPFYDYEQAEQAKAMYRMNE